MKRLSRAVPALLFVAASLVSGNALACAACGCSLSSDAAMGYSSASGWRLNLQYNYIDQSQLRHGWNSVSPSDVAAINDAGGDQEVEDNTINRHVILGLTYAPSADWNFHLKIPYLDRAHSTYGESGNPLTPDKLSGASITGLGDIKLIGNYQGFLPRHNLGVQLGIKLPTGHYGGPDASGTGVVGNDPDTWSTGPASKEASPGNLVDTSLQAGTGSTDVIVGAYYFRPVSQNFDAFINGQFQAAVKENLDGAGEDYRPGNQTTISVGTRYEASPEYTPQLQLNVTRKSHDRGALADTANSSGTTAFLSPGISLNMIRNLQFYGFVQIPVYSHLGGYQLFPRWIATAGVSYAL